jgi:hypothetical protein
MPRYINGIHAYYFDAYRLVHLLPGIHHHLTAQNRCCLFTLHGHLITYALSSSIMKYPGS